MAETQDDAGDVALMPRQDSVRPIVLKAALAQFAEADWSSRDVRVRIYQRIEGTVLRWAAQSDGEGPAAESVREMLLQALVEIERKAQAASDLGQLTAMLNAVPAAAPSAPPARAATAQPTATTTPEQAPATLASPQSAPAQGSLSRWLPMAAVAALGLIVLLQTVLTPLWPLRPASGCTPTSAVCAAPLPGTPGPGLTPEDARALQVSIFQVTPDKDYLYARIRLTNTGSRTIHGLSPNPTRLSWRIRSWAQDASAGREQFNAVRIELGGDIAPRQTIEVPIVARLPADRSQLSRVFDVVFLSEGKFWSFDAGVPVAQERLSQ